MPRKKKEEKPERRVRGEGTVIQREDGRYVARVPLGGGKRKEEYYDTRQEAERARRRMLNERDTGKLVTQRDQTLGDYLIYWLGVHSMTIRLTTHSMYRTYMLEFINPELGHVGLRKLTTEMFQKLYQKWEKEEMSPNTIRLIHTIVKKALKDAVMWKKLAYNPLEYVKLPKKRKTIVHVFSDEEIERLLQSAKQMRMYLLFRMALLLGVRLGELSGLQWSDIDFVKGVLSIKRTVSYVRHPVTHAFGFYVGEPKTDTSERAIFLPHEILASLQVHREEQMKLIGTTSNWRDLNLVFCVGNGNYVNPNYVRVLFDRLLQKAGLEHMKFHGLRHNASLILRKLGIDPVVRKEMLGHSSLFMTDDVYGHSTEKMHKDAAAEISRLFGED